MRFRFYTTSEKAWDAMIEAIASARTSIYWECYIALDDTVTHRFYELLEQKAKEGVRVKIVVDRVGSWMLYDDVRERLSKAGAELLYFNHVLPWWNRKRFLRWWFLRNHRKVLIVDEQVAFVGGVNVGEEFRQWFDLHLRLDGLVVRRFLRAFVRTYRASGGHDPRVFVPRLKMRKDFLTRAKLFYLSSWPGRRSGMTLQQYYTHRCARAKERITIITPYFIPHRWLIQSLHSARLRGVAVEVILPQKADYWFLQQANETFALLIARLGVRVIMTPTMHHAKAVIIDRTEAMVGSNNIDAMSFDFNLEGNVVFQRRDMITRLEHIIDRWRLTAKPFIDCTVHSRWYHWLRERVFLILQPLL